MSGRRCNGMGPRLLMGLKSDDVTSSEAADVLIAGGGFAGLALALALRQALGPDFAVTVADPEFGRGDDPRASAIAAAPRRMFEALGVWPAVAADAQEIRDMIITDSRVEDAVRLVFLSFEGDI